MNNRQIVLKGVRVNNLKNIDLSLEKNKIIIFTGVSGSGKSSLAFDTIYIEGQRRYIETLPHSAKRFIHELKKPLFSKIEGLSPTIAIEQKTISKNPRSTVATITSIYDFLRVLFAKKATFHCPISGEVVSAQTADEIIDNIKNFEKDNMLFILAPYAENKKGSFSDDFKDLLKRGFLRIRVDGDIFNLEDIGKLDKTIPHDVDIVIDRIKIEKENDQRLKEAVYQALDIGNGFFKIINIKTDEEKSFSKYAYAKKSKNYYPPLKPRDFSFNSPYGMCKKCSGLGEIFEFDLDKVIDWNLGIGEDCSIIASSFHTVRYGNIYKNLAKIYNFDLETPFKDLSKKAQDIFLYGTKKKWTPMIFYHPEKKIRWREYVRWEGVLAEAKKRLESAKSDAYKKKMKLLMHHMICPECEGHRLKKYPLAATFHGKRIYEITEMTVEEAISFFEKIEKRDNISSPLIKEITKRLTLLKDVGLGYLQIDRKAPTLSGGEAQRVKLSSQVGSGLIGTTYILDEPSIGLHPYDHQKLINTLEKLKKRKNTIIIVEHDEDTIRSGDYIVDIGPYAGKSGGEIVAKGSLKDIMGETRSITGKYLKGELKIELPLNKRSASKYITLKNASLNNLKDVDLKVPIGLLTVITGVSGAGKSSLISNTLFPAINNRINRSHIEAGPYKSIEGLENIERITFVDQSPIGKMKRSNPGTYVKVLDDIRDLFASLKESRARGYKKGHFSFNVKEGSCIYCRGLGEVKVDMDFMEDLWTTCGQCMGKRFDPEILDIKYKGHNIYDVLNMEVGDALKLFFDIPKIKRKLLLLEEVGLSYLHLEQSSDTLSGGEAQRIKLAKELGKKRSGKTLYILDEPTRGLHFFDVQKLLTVLNNLTDLGNSVVVIEHNPHFIKMADHIIELGPSSGKDGGKIIFEGDLKTLLKKNTKTALALKKRIEKKEKEKVPEDRISSIEIRGASTHNLKDLSLDIPLNKLSIFTGPSGSGKTSLAFDTIHAEASRRYLDTLPPYMRQFVEMLPKPSIKTIKNLPPSIAVEQKNKSSNSRSTVGTITEIYDHLRVIFAHMGVAYSPETAEEIKAVDKNFVAEKILDILLGKKAYILSPIKFYRGESFEDLKKRVLKEGFLRIRLNKKYFELEEKVPFNRAIKNEIFLVIDRLIIKKSEKKRILDSLELASKRSSEIIISQDSKDHYFNLSFSSVKSGKSYPKITPQTFSFNSERGMCLECQGIGNIYGIDEEELFGYSTHDIIDQIAPTASFKKLLKKCIKSEKIDLDIPIEDLPKKKRNILLYGGDRKERIDGLYFRWRGFFTLFATFAKHALFPIRFYLLPKMVEKRCPACKGKRLNPLACNVKVDGKTLPSICSMDIKSLHKFIGQIKIVKPFLRETILQIKKELNFLIGIGLGYLSLDRSSPSLSGGEMMRLYLAKHLGAGLSNCLYILDEPTIGLHPLNSDLLIKALARLKKLQNTIILVEHDPLVIKEADYIFDFGPLAGRDGGKIVSKGTLDEIKKDKNSLTGDYLSNRKKINIPTKKRVPKEFIKIKDAKLHNLKNLEVDIPKNILVAISGVSGSGKSTLLSILKKGIKEAIKTKKDKIDLGFAKLSNLQNIKKLVTLGQNLLVKNRRSDISTYSEIMPIIRSLFASLPQSKARGYKPRYFSYNHKRGMCMKCYGLGYKRVDLQFLPPVKITCKECNGHRLNRRSLEIKYRGKHIGDILNMRIEEALDFFEAFPHILKKLKTLISTGLGYLKLGQDISTLSGGEGQRLKLSKELTKRSNAVYLLDEPTIGLHPHDIKNLLKIFQSMTDRGNSLIIIEHNQDLIASCDHIIDLGPDGGPEGGEVVAYGPLEDILKNKKSHTAKYLRKI